MIPGGIIGECIVYIAVAPKYRRRGIGFALVHDVVKSFKENGFFIRLPQNMISENIRESEYVYVSGKNF